MAISKHIAREKVEAIKHAAGAYTTSEVSRETLLNLCQKVETGLTYEQLCAIIDSFPGINGGNVKFVDWLGWLSGDDSSKQPSLQQSETSATLRVVHVTDVYILDNFPHLRNLILQKRAELNAAHGVDSKTISMLSGDFLMPYLLSSVDKGRGMMQTLNATPIAYLTWGNHEADLPHLDVLDREKEYSGIWINTNMTSPDSFKRPETSQRDSVVLEVKSTDGSNIRHIGLIGILSNEAKLYKPGAFGDATIEDPWDTMREYKAKLENEQGCDLVLPFCHLYEPQDEKTANEFDFPIVLSGHDHHVVDRWVNGTRIVKPGSDAHHAVVLDITWDKAGDCKPTINVELVKVADWDPDPEMKSLVQKCYSILDNLRQTQLCTIQAEFRPLSSVGSRSKCTSCAKFLCTAIRNSLNIKSMDPLNLQVNLPSCDCVLINGGNFRGEHDYAEDEPFTLESLMSEIDEKVNIWVLELPGSILHGALRETWAAPSGSWMQHCNAVTVDTDNYVKTINGSGLQRDRLYRVGTTERFGVLESPSIRGYLEESPHEKPSPEVAIQAQALLMFYFAEVAWVYIWRKIDVDGDGKITRRELNLLDTDHSGDLYSKELLSALRNEINFQTYVGEFALVDKMLEVAGDRNGDGHLTVEEMNCWRRHRLKQLNVLMPPAGP